MTAEIEQLKQLTTVTWDGNLVSKDARKRLVKRGYVRQSQGWNLLTKAGVKVLVDLGLLKAQPQPVVGGGVK